MANEARHSLGSGGFVLSLDLELMWGVYGTHTTESYGANVRGVRRVVPALLDLFEEHRIAATWAVVGMACFDRRDELMGALPTVRPAFEDERLSSYAHLDAVGPDEASDPLHLGASLVRAIAACQDQEIATHTFSHLYCLEPAPGDVPFDRAAFGADLDAALEALARMGMRPRSIVFPRNQILPEALRECRVRGMTVFRGTGAAGPSRARRDEGRLHRLVRFARDHAPAGSAASRAVREVDGMIDVPASRFLRPYRRALPLLSKMQGMAIRADMRRAARAGALYHLWFHPHNFGVPTAENVAVLRGILDEAVRLREAYGWPSLTMAGAAGLPTRHAEPGDPERTLDRVQRREVA